MMVGRLLSFWDGIFSGALLNFQGVTYNLIEMNEMWRPPAGFLIAEDPGRTLPESNMNQPWEDLGCYVAGKT